MKQAVLTVSVAGLFAGLAQGQIRITEWMYQGGSGEFIEVTNLSGAPVDMSGWWFDDDSALPGVFSLAPLGILQPGQSGIITEAAAADFRAAWNLDASVPVAGSNTANLGRNDQINIFNGLTLIDTLTYGDQNFPGSVRTQNRSGITTFSNLGLNNVSGWFLSAVGDSFGSVVSAQGDVGSPGFVPTPGAAGLLGLGAIAAMRRRR